MYHFSIYIIQQLIVNTIHAVYSHEESWYNTTYQSCIHRVLVRKSFVVRISQQGGEGNYALEPVAHYIVPSPNLSQGLYIDTTHWSRWYWGRDDHWKKCCTCWRDWMSSVKGHACCATHLIGVATYRIGPTRAPLRMWACSKGMVPRIAEDGKVTLVMVRGKVRVLDFGLVSMSETLCGRYRALSWFGQLIPIVLLCLIRISDT